MNSEQHSEFPTKEEFLAKLHAEIDNSSNKADQICKTLGEKLPATLDSIGAVLSTLYRLACCAWGCRGGDHQVERLCGRVVNQAISSHRLIRAGFYDEALTLIRGIGETANLLWLFQHDQKEMDAWKAANRKVRLKEFGPFQVRTKLENALEMGPPIDQERYSRLCEVATHPTPSILPGHFSGLGRPVLGVILQPAGVFVTMTELGYAVAMATIPFCQLLEPKQAVRQELFDEAVSLIESLGDFTVLNYEELLANAHRSIQP